MRKTFFTFLLATSMPLFSIAPDESVLELVSAWIDYTNFSNDNDPKFHCSEKVFKKGKRLGKKEKQRTNPLTPPPSPPPEETDELGRTALHEAASKGALSAVKSLVKANANVNARTHHQDTPLKIAQLKKHDPVIRYLASVGGIT